jgi:DNA end-binding protein Ku
VPEEKHRARRLRPFWSGTIAFGLVSIPVGLFVASRSTMALRMVDAEGTPLQRRYFCSKDAEPLEAADIVRGYEVEQDRFVIVRDEELDALAPEKSREIDLKRFVPREQIDPIWFERGYFLAPEKGAIKAYRLLARALEETSRVGVATFVMRGKEYLVAIIGQQGLLRAETLRFHDELRTPDDVEMPPLGKADAARVKAMEKEIRALSADELDREALADDTLRRLQRLIDHKIEAGIDILGALGEPEAEEPEGAEIVDLMEILKKSLGKSGGVRARGKAQRNARDDIKHSALNEHSKAELYRRAQELEIAGRSKLTREELIEAIRMKC